MQVNSVTINFDNFRDAAMQDNRTAEVCRILRELADRCEENGVVNTFEGRYLVDTNGNRVGLTECDWED